MSKTNFIATDTILVGAELKSPGDKFEVTGDAAAAKMLKYGHLVEGSKEADAFLAKKANKKNFASKMTKEAKPPKHPFNSEEVDADEDEEEEEVVDTKAKTKGGKGKAKGKEKDLA